MWARDVRQKPRGGEIHLPVRGYLNGSVIGTKRSTLPVASARLLPFAMSDKSNKDSKEKPDPKPTKRRINPKRLSDTIVEV